MRRDYRVPPSRGRVLAFAGVVVAFAVIAGVIWAQRPAGSSLTQLPAAIATKTVAATDSARELVLPAGQGAQSGREAAQPLGVDDGSLPDGASVFDQRLPGVANLDAQLLAAVRRAANAAAADGVRFTVDSGWRSRDYQAHLLQEAVAKYGSADEAARWVAPPDRSEHVRGNAIDLGPRDAASWLADHGAAYGLCRIYANEPWHFELRPAAATGGCLQPFADPTHDPRMHP